jgi:glycosyltransferase involved in cell wall biosynthesis
MYKGLKINYIFNVRFPTERAHGIQVSKMCEALALLGHEVELVVPNRDPGITEEAYSYYAVKNNFRIRKLWCLDVKRLGKLRFPLQTLTFLISTTLYSLGNRGIFYTRDSFVAALLKILCKRTVWEAHMGVQNIFTKLIFVTKTPVVVITYGLKNLYVSLGADLSCVHVAPDGVDLNSFINGSTFKTRNDVGWPMDKKIVLYSGHLYPWKGAHTLVQAIEKLDKYIEVVLIGGTDKDLKTFKDFYGHIGNLKIMGKKPHAEIPSYLALADLLVLPNSAKENISKSYTSPMKLFEYMTSRVPIIASDLPSIKEILSEKEAYFFKPDDAEDLAGVIKEVIAEEDLPRIKSQNAYDKVQKYSWLKRAEGIINFIHEKGI